MMVLSGDIGGTSTRLLLAEFGDNDKLKVVKIGHYSNSDFASFYSIVDTFFTEANISSQQISSACFGVAGPIVNGIVKFTNLPWVIRLNETKEKLKLEVLYLINDFEAIGYGIETLTPEDFFMVQQGKARENSVRAFIGAGTGLGIGFMTRTNGSYVVYPTEGGHVDFAPTDDTQVDLLRYMRKKYHRVSFERVLSGPGLVHIYHFVRDNKIFGEDENPELRFLIEGDQNIDIAATVAKYAIKHGDILAQRALDIFMRIYGAAVGNLALTTLPYAGLYIVGGIAPKLLEQIKGKVFMDMYYDKGRMANLIKDIPLNIVLNTDVGLQGAAIYAYRKQQQH
ncbi:MAG: glucokinase [Gammaproteobacteria bacterium]|nr:glucokinase [Gammaproteobacteria bacterium]